MVVAADIREIGGREIDVRSLLLSSFSFWWSVFFCGDFLKRQSIVSRPLALQQDGRINCVCDSNFFLRSIPNNIRETMMLGIYNRGSQNFVVGE